MRWDRVDIRGEDECWVWLGAINNRGYGRFGTSYAHRLAYADVYGEIPKGMLVCHHCDNPPCCNPSHLFVGSYRDNTLDMLRKGRGWQGSTFPKGTHPYWATEALRAKIIAERGGDFCPRGHARNAENFYFYEGRLYHCLVCRRERRRERRQLARARDQAKKREAAA